MVKLAWGSPGARYFETGVDRGVLFVDGTGYAWSGLVSVEEKSSGGDLQEYFLDGVKYAQIMTSENFVATLEALSSPREFGVCDGSFEIYSGFSAGQQRRKSFGLSYRTKIGDDLNGVDASYYKLHVVYNALVGPAGRTHSTLSDNVNPETTSWEISTVPEALSGVRPTAHFVIDSRRADPTDLATLEDLLYGTNVTTPTLPTSTALAAIFA